MMKLLIVDDEYFTIRMLRNLLDWENLGIEICGEARDGEEALGKIQLEHPDIVITDIRMPVMNGLELVKKAAALYGKIKFIMMSAYSDVEYLKEAMKLGCCDYILKPIDEYELEDTLQNVVKKIRGEKEEARMISRKNEQLEQMSIYHCMTTGQNWRGKNANQGIWRNGRAYSVFLIQIQNSSINEYVTTNQVELIKTGYLSNVIRSVIGEVTPEAMVFDCGENIWSTILPIGDTREKVLAAEKIIAGIEKEIGLHAQICFSQTGNEISQLHGLYEDAGALMKYSFYAGDARVLGHGYNCSREEFEEICKIGKQKERAVAEKATAVKKQTEQTAYSRPVTESLAILEEKYNENLSLDEICSRIAVSKNYFCYLFKREVGTSIWNYLTELRVRHAKELLANTDLKSYEIAFQVGYDNPSYFSKLFKKCENMSPNEYREKKRTCGKGE